MSIPANKILESLLDYSALKHKVIGQNIANANTKNYKRKEVEFKDLLNEGIQNLSGSASNSSQLEVKDDEDTVLNSQGNNVDVNREMADMAENSIMFRFASKKLNGYYRTLQSVIRGGK